MSERTGYLGYKTGKSSDKVLSPQNPQTGDGKTQREPHDRVRITGWIRTRK